MGIGLGDVIDVAPHEDQLAGASLAFGGGDAGLGAPDLAFEVVALAALCFQEFFFPGFKLLFEGLLPGQKLLEFFLWLPSPSMVASDPQRGQF